MTLKEFYGKYDKQIDNYIRQALKEDKAYSDVTANLLFKGSNSNRIVTADLLCKDNCLLAGLEIFKRVYRQISSKVKFQEYCKDGDLIRSKTIVLKVKSPLNVLLAGERVSLNFLQRMSAAATLTNEFVKRLRFKDAKILHTRKTTPNFRLFETAAVKIGGGDFHRLDLGSSVMVKDNHIIAAGSIERVLDLINSKKIKGKLKNRFEVEVKNFYELGKVVEKGKGIIRIVMLDNFNPVKIKKASRILKQSGFQVEVSGGINLKSFSRIQNESVDYYSIGILTHSYKSVDFSLEFWA